MHIYIVQLYDQTIYDLIYILSSKGRWNASMC